MPAERENSGLVSHSFQDHAMTTVWIYVDTRYLPGHPDYIKVFANPVAADEWCKQNDPEGVAFEYEVIEE
jgi:hypothetical protein